MNVREAPADPEQRAWWHLELSPEHFYEPLLVDPVDQPPELIDADEWDDDGVGGLDTCPECGENSYFCRCHDGDECGRWDNGRLTSRCAKAGSEECDFECPYRDTLRF